MTWELVNGPALAVVGVGALGWLAWVLVRRAEQRDQGGADEPPRVPRPAHPRGEHMSAELIAFYRARLDESAALAEAAIEPEAMHPYGDTGLPQSPVERWPDEVRGYLGGPWGEHCAAHDPTAVLADIAAKRAILALHEGPHECTSADDNCVWIPTDARPHCETVALLAAVCAAHPEYRAEWAP